MGRETIFAGIRKYGLGREADLDIATPINWFHSTLDFLLPGLRDDVAFPRQSEEHGAAFRPDWAICRCERMFHGLLHDDGWEAIL